MCRSLVFTVTFLLSPAPVTSDEYIVWSPIEPSLNSPQPPSRTAHAATYQALSETAALGNEVWIFGGIDNNLEPINDLWQFDMRVKMWYRMNATAPQARAHATMVAVGSNLYLFGGWGEEMVHLNDLHMFDTHALTWMALNSSYTSGPVPKPRSYHSMTRVIRKLFIWGGQDQVGDYLNDLYVYDTDTFNWTHSITIGPNPTERKGHTMTLVDSMSKLLLFGGTGTGDVLLSDVHLLDVANPDNHYWTTPQTYGRLPPGREGHSATYMDGRLYVFGGVDQTQTKLADLQILDLTTFQWTMPNEGELFPTARWGHSMTLIQKNLYLFGGVDQDNQPLMDMWEMDRHCHRGDPVKLVDHHGSFSDGNGFYFPNADCKWLIDPKKPNTVINLFFSEFDLEDKHDYLYIYDGTSTDAPLLTEGPLTNDDMPKNQMGTQAGMLVHFKADAANSAPGFTATYLSVCQPGYVGNPVDPNGYCIACPPGSISPVADQRACSSCPLRFYQPDAGKTACLSCPPNSHTLTIGATSIESCVCDRGYYLGASAPNCTLCPDGATCAGGASPVRARKGFCRDTKTKFKRCCDKELCPGGDYSCPEDTKVVDVWDQCEEESAVPGLTQVAFVITLCLVICACCVCIIAGAAYTVGKRRGTMEAQADMVEPFEKADEDEVVPLSPQPSADSEPETEEETEEDLESGGAPPDYESTAGGDVELQDVDEDEYDSKSESTEKGQGPSVRTGTTKQVLPPISKSDSGRADPDDVDVEESDSDTQQKDDLRT